MLAVNAEVSDLNLEATLTDTQKIVFESEASVGKGRLAFEGGIEGLGEDAPVLTTEVTLARAGVINLPDY